MAIVNCVLTTYTSPTDRLILISSVHWTICHLQREQKHSISASRNPPRLPGQNCPGRPPAQQSQATKGCQVECQGSQPVTALFNDGEETMQQKEMQPLWIQLHAWQKRVIISLYVHLLSVLGEERTDSELLYTLHPVCQICELVSAVVDPLLILVDVGPRIGRCSDRWHPSSRRPRDHRVGPLDLSRDSLKLLERRAPGVRDNSKHPEAKPQDPQLHLPQPSAQALSQLLSNAKAQLISRSPPRLPPPWLLAPAPWVCAAPAKQLKASEIRGLRG
eukprot:CAMPEP_0184327304 /NCGR_PEP_ID=MMETSP1049-20130417/143026_1 /TAXON_ID=77928 /ORGANISM="Proteomonas sulcata, Strain CCMP704" /LENGTH=274 /DNA_ID=CAMNT_0026649557 /DNA_START=58 /DNA_END=884 /DNA_ORIENTATION=-